MQNLDRRTFLSGTSQVGLALAVAYGLSGCGGKESSGNATGKMTWWETGKPQAALNRKYVAAHKAELGNAAVEVSFMLNNKLGQALQLAKQSNQLPDLTINAGLKLPLASLIANGWFEPLNLPDDANERLKSMGLLEGIHIFDGKTYSFPVRGPGYNTITWYHIDKLSKAGVDPASPPATYDEFREVLRKVRKAGSEGLLHPLAAAERNGIQFDYLAQSAGFAGRMGRLFHTGEYAFHSDSYIAPIEFMYSLYRDGLLMRGGITMNPTAAEGRWAGGASAFFFDGPWVPGVVAVEHPKLKGKIEAGPMLVPDSSHQPVVYWEPIAGTYYIPKGAKNVELANQVMGLLTTMDYQVAWAEAMSHAPRDIEAVKTAKVEPIWRKVVETVHEDIFTAPDPVVRNVDVAKVETELKPVQPGLGNIIQGYFSGAIKDLKAALTKLSDDSAKELERAIRAAKSKGAKVSFDDYVFPNWKPNTHFTKEMYG